MRILAIYRYYWPDTAPYGRILRLILGKLVSNGHSATVFSGFPAYGSSAKKYKKLRCRQMDSGVHIRRVRLFPESRRKPLIRILNYCLFILMAVFYAWRHRKEYDLVWVNSFPPVAMGFCARIIRILTGLGYLYHCQDVHPESLNIAGRLQPGFFC